MPKAPAAALFLCAAFFLNMPAVLAAESFQDHQLKLRDENTRFRQSLEAQVLTSEERAAAVKAHRESQYQINKAYYDGLHKDQMAAFKAKLEKNPAIKEAQRKTLLDNAKKQYKAFTDFRDKEHDKGRYFYS
jgi:hypothetical protein